MCLFANQTYGMTFVNAIYWGVVSGTTVGYGDISPSNDGTKIFCMFFLVFAVITTANALGTVGDALMEGSDGQVMSILDKKLDAAFLMSIDMDGSGEVTEFEYLAAMLIRLNHVDQDQIDSIMKAFRKLDQDGSGSLSVSDLTANLKSEKKKKKAAEKSCEQESPEVLEEVSNWGEPAASEAPAEDVIRDAEKALEE